MSKKNIIAEQEIKIKDSLFDFVKIHIPEADLNLIDEIVLSYVVAVLEDVGSDPIFDVEGFCEMMAAYFPEFESINHASVCQWMFELEAKLQEAEREEDTTSFLDISLPEIVPKMKPRFSYLADENGNRCKEKQNIPKPKNTKETCRCEYYKRKKRSSLPPEK